jgi:hypothetical protein
MPPDIQLMIFINDEPITRMIACMRSGLVVPNPNPAKSRGQVWSVPFIGVDNSVNIVDSIWGHISTAYGFRSLAYRQQRYDPRYSCDPQLTSSINLVIYYFGSFDGRKGE